MELVTIYRNKETKQTYCLFGEISLGTKKVWLYCKEDATGHSDVLENVENLNKKYSVIDTYYGD